MSQKEIEGRIARVLNDRQVVINKGKKDGVKKKMIFKILNEKGLNISDPITHEDLGSVEIIKTYVKVVEVYEKLSVASTFITRTIRKGGIGIPDFNVFTGPSTVEKVETLKIADSNSPRDISEDDSIVKIGDFVVYVEDEPLIS